MSQHRSTLGPLLGVALVATGLGLARPVPAHAYEDQVGLFATGGYGAIVGDTPYPPHALSLGLGVSVGLGDVWELRGRFDYAHHVSAMNRLTGSVDLVYLVDVLSVVPYVGVSAGGAVSVLPPSFGLGEVRADLIVGAVLGLDVLLGRELTIGVELRPAWALTDFDREPMLLSALLRAQWLLEI